MPDKINKPSGLVETLSLFQVLEGLIHNINTPLNVIIGYSQQLNKQYPEIKYLEKITQAGLDIDDMVRACSEAFINRADTTDARFDINKLVTDEIKLLQNILEIKHSIKFELKLFEQEIIVSSKPLLLSLFLESLILFIRNSCEFLPGDRTISISTLSEVHRAVLEIRLPVCNFKKSNLHDYLDELQAELAESFELAEKGFPFVVEITSNNRIKILFKK
jgi:signal transduction histidine kinase